MLRHLTICLLALRVATLWAEEPVRDSPTVVPAGETSVVIIPIEGPIARPLLYIVRRGLKEAIENGAEAVVLDINTPGGEMGVTLEIMEALDKFPGRTIAYVNTEAISAGAFISAASHDIYFAPGSVIGAAAPVTAGGADIDETMKAKLVSYMKGKVRAVSEGKGYRGEVISAMIDVDYELKIDDKVIKPKGGLLTLTASEASELYGDPPQPLLAAGIAKDMDDLLRQCFGEGQYTQQTLQVTWSEQLAVALNAVVPLLLGLGLLALFIEFKTPGFGIFGIAGMVLLGLVFLSQFVAGFSGHEPVLIFALGLLLIAVEIFFFPGTVVMALSGVILMLGSLLWAMADIWPNEPVVISGDLFMGPLINLSLGLVVAIGGAVVVLRFLPRGWFWDRMILNAAVGQTQSAAIAAPAASKLVGRTGVAATDLFPSGQVEIDGRRYEAKVGVGSIEAGQTVVVVAEQEFGLLVEAVEAEDGQ
ncbi:MAG: ATP-dependent Clp protease proteolytic subunit [Opitutaceae bacterium]|nr:ATP-dependent Clp protease proteolytic subunit [Opitutaceae bacterium]